VSAAVGERVRAARNDSPKVHASRQEQMKRIIASMRPR
jgi:hypothetical protein